MSYLLTSVIIALFCGLVFLNLYFRMKVMRSYKYLSKQHVEFSISHIFNSVRLHAEVLPRYPKHEVQILEFVHQIRNSLKWALLIIVSIIIAGIVLNVFFR